MICLSKILRKLNPWVRVRVGLLKCSVAKFVLMLFGCFGTSDFESETFVCVECHLPVVLPFRECFKAML